MSDVAPAPESAPEAAPEPEPAPAPDPAADPAVAVEPPAEPVADPVEAAPAPEPAEPVAPAPEEPAAVEPPPVRPVATIDSSVTQGNRITTQQALTPNDPVKILIDKITRHFDSVNPVLADIRAAVDQLQALLDRLKVGN